MNGIVIAVVATVAACAAIGGIWAAIHSINGLEDVKAELSQIQDLLTVVDLHRNQVSHTIDEIYHDGQKHKQPVDKYENM